MIDPVQLGPPVDRVEPRLDDLVLSWLFVWRFLLAIDIRIKEVDFGFFHLPALKPLSLCFLDFNFMANFDSKHIAIVILLLILVLNVVWWKLGHAKLVLSPEEFHVQKFIDQVADHLTLASLQVFGLTVLRDLTAELAQV